MIVTARLRINTLKNNLCIYSNKVSMTHETIYIEKLYIAYVYIPVLERKSCICHKLELTSHQIPERYYFTGLSTRAHLFISWKIWFKGCGLSISEEQLQEVAKLSGALRITNKHLENDFKNRCAELVEQPGNIDAKDCANVYLSIKQGVNAGPFRIGVQSHSHAPTHT